MYEIYLYDGTPIQVFAEWQLPTDKPYTFIKPPQGIWAPIYFDEDSQTWVGTTPPITEMDVKDVERAINTQNETIKLITERSNKLMRDYDELIKFTGNLLLQVAYIKRHIEMPGVAIDVNDAKYFYEKGLYNDFTIKILVDNGSLLKRDYKDITGEDYPVYVDENE